MLNWLYRKSIFILTKTIRTKRMLYSKPNHYIQKVFFIVIYKNKKKTSRKLAQLKAAKNYYINVLTSNTVFL